MAVTLKQAYGLNGPGDNIWHYSGGFYYSSSLFNNNTGANLSIDTIKFGYPVIKIPTTGSGIYRYFPGYSGKTIHVSFDCYTTDYDLTFVHPLNEGGISTDYGGDLFCPKGSWKRLWVTSTVTRDFSIVFYPSVIGSLTFYLRNFKVCECDSSITYPLSYTPNMISDPVAATIPGNGIYTSISTSVLNNLKSLNALTRNWSNFFGGKSIYWYADRAASFRANDSNPGQLNLSPWWSFTPEYRHSWVNDPYVGYCMEVQHVSGNIGNWQLNCYPDISNYRGHNLVFYIVAKKMTASSNFNFGVWNTHVSLITATSPYIDLGNDWKLYYAQINDPNIGQLNNNATGINTVAGTMRFAHIGIVQDGTIPSNFNYLDSYSKLDYDISSEVIQHYTAYTYSSNVRKRTRTQLARGMSAKGALSDWFSINSFAESETAPYTDYGAWSYSDPVRTRTITYRWADGATNSGGTQTQTATQSTTYSAWTYYNNNSYRTRAATPTFIYSDTTRYGTAVTERQNGTQSLGVWSYSVTYDSATRSRSISYIYNDITQAGGVDGPYGGSIQSTITTGYSNWTYSSDNTHRTRTFVYQRVWTWGDDTRTINSAPQQQYQDQKYQDVTIAGPFVRCEGTLTVRYENRTIYHAYLQDSGQEEVVYDATTEKILSREYIPGSCGYDPTPVSISISSSFFGTALTTSSSSIAPETIFIEVALLDSSGSIMQILNCDISKGNSMGETTWYGQTPSQVGVYSVNGSKSSPVDGPTGYIYTF